MANEDLYNEIGESISLTEAYLDAEEKENNKIVIPNYTMEGIFSSILNGIKKFFKKLIGFIIKIWKYIVNFCKKIWRGIVDLFNKIFNRNKNNKTDKPKVATFVTEGLAPRKTRYDNYDQLKKAYLDSVNKIQREINIRSKENIEQTKKLEKISTKAITESMNTYLEERYSYFDTDGLENADFYMTHDTQYSDFNKKTKELLEKNPELKKIFDENKNHDFTTMVGNSVGNLMFEKDINFISKEILETIAFSQENTSYIYETLVGNRLKELLDQGPIKCEEEKEKIAFIEKYMPKIIIGIPKDQRETFKKSIYELILNRGAMRSLLASYKEMIDNFYNGFGNEDVAKIGLMVLNPDLSLLANENDIKKRDEKIRKWAMLKLNHNKLLIQSLKNMLILNKTVFLLSSLDIENIDKMTDEEILHTSKVTLQHYLHDYAVDHAMASPDGGYTIDFSSIKLKDVGIKSGREHLGIICADSEFGRMFNKDTRIDLSSDIDYFGLNAGNFIMTDFLIQNVINWDIVVMAHGGTIWEENKYSTDVRYNTRAWNNFVGMYNPGLAKNGEFEIPGSQAAWRFAEHIVAPNGVPCLYIEEFLDQVFEMDPHHTRFKRIRILSCNPGNVVLSKRFNVPGVIIQFAKSTNSF